MEKNVAVVLNTSSGPKVESNIARIVSHKTKQPTGTYEERAAVVARPKFASCRRVAMMIPDAILMLVTTD